jgi:hypothetical protein
MQIFGGNPDNLEERLGRWLLVETSNSEYAMEHHELGTFVIQVIP